jgi:protein ImuB
MMTKRIVSVWFRHLLADWWALRRPELKNKLVILVTADHSRMIVAATNLLAQKAGITIGMPAADARAMFPDLEVLQHQQEQAQQILEEIAEWCLRYTPIACVDLENDGLLLDVTGCPHLWGDETIYLKVILTRIRASGYDVRGALASSVGTAWAVCRFSQAFPIIQPGDEAAALGSLPPSALRLPVKIIQRLLQLGYYQIHGFLSMPRSMLRRRFGQDLLVRIDQALGLVEEPLRPLQPVVAYQERLPCLEPIRNRAGIEIALHRLLEGLCKQLQADGKGLRSAILKCHRVDGEIIQIQIGTNRPSHHLEHIFKLFELEISKLRPELGIELFLLEAPITEEAEAVQETMWAATGSLIDPSIAELLDRITHKLGPEAVQRFLPRQHYWPERSFKPSASLQEKPAIPWPQHRRRPILILPVPEPIQVAAPLPDYPPILFIYKEHRCYIKKADGPERISNEWWLESGEHRDYYAVEDEAGKRYWLFRSGHYQEDGQSKWFLHGFFA